MNHAEIVVVGAGPAGIAAATAAAHHGCGVLLLDDNPAPGGQIWRGGTQPFRHRKDTQEDAAKTKALHQLRSSGATILSSVRVFDAPAPSTLLALRETEGNPEILDLRYDRLILATGARERFLPFPGWTLPGVFGAGGLQALVKGGFPIHGKRILVAGSGPLLLAVAAHLLDDGAHITSVAEQAPISQLIPFTASLWSASSKDPPGDQLPYRPRQSALPHRLLASRSLR